MTTESSHTIEPELMQSVPRTIAACPRHGLLSRGCSNCLILPHTLIGLSLAFWLIYMTFVNLAGQVVTGQVVSVNSYTSSKSQRRFTQVQGVYQVGGAQYTLNELVPGDREKQLPPGTPIRLKISPISPGTHTTLLFTGWEGWNDLGGLLFFTVFWNGILFFFWWPFFIRPWIYRRLVQRGVPAIGTVEGKYITNNRPVYYYVRYSFQAYPADSAVPKTVRGKCVGEKEDWEALEEGEPVTILYHPCHPRLNVIYRLANYIVVEPG